MSRDHAVVQLFEPGDTVSIREEILRGRKYQDLVPKLLIKREGFPNEFLVRAVARDPAGKPAISLFPCCYTLVRRGDYRCRWHPANLFERARFEKIKPGVPGEDRPDGKGDRTYSIETPLSDVVSLEFQDDKDPRLNLTCHGPYGQILRGLFKFAKSKGVL